MNSLSLRDSVPRRPRGRPTLNADEHLGSALHYSAPQVSGIVLYSQQTSQHVATRCACPFNKVLLYISYRLSSRPMTHTLLLLEQKLRLLLLDLIDVPARGAGHVESTLDVSLHVGHTNCLGRNAPPPKRATSLPSFLDAATRGPHGWRYDSNGFSWATISEGNCRTGNCMSSETLSPVGVHWRE